MPSNEELSARAKQLLSDIESITESARDHSNDYRKLSDEAYTSLQAFISSKGVKTVDEWLQICLKQLSPEEAVAAQKILDDMKPPQGLKALTTPTEIAQFFAGCYILKGGLPLLKQAALSARSWFNNYLVINRLPVVQTSIEAEATTIASTAEELTGAVEFIESEEVPALVATAEVEIAEVTAAEVAAAAEVGTVATAEVASSWNVFLLAAGAVVLAGTYGYSKYKASKDADELRKTIRQLATARLYALAGEKSVLAQTDQGSLLMILKDVLKKPESDQLLVKNTGLITVKANLASVDVDQCFLQLQAQDKGRNSMTDADPDLQTMKRDHVAEVEKLKHHNK
ncbi:hypothetical protein BP6252_13826 [Coleophoma cylindrospora]|uniref:Uncharacterized protein n=1 Tax=Coleophoma cylindrospora TaxID=1849047 RepID=A0A3D8Q6B3_9HELO|nr:hypothetical protein BP6252_13826 [Coleophoma cylindrospora]